MAYICHPVTFLSSFSHFFSWLNGIAWTCVSTHIFWACVLNYWWRPVHNSYLFCMTVHCISVRNFERCSENSSWWGAYGSAPQQFLCNDILLWIRGKTGDLSCIWKYGICFFNSLFYILIIALSLSETLYYFGILYLSYFVLF